MATFDWRDATIAPEGGDLRRSIEAAVRARSATRLRFRRRIPHLPCSPEEEKATAEAGRAWNSRESGDGLLGKLFGRLMPKRTDISSILIIGAGPIVIGQAAEFDYSGSQAVKALKAEGYRVIVVNSNPATIMTDPELADATYIEPITPEIVAKIIEKETADACCRRWAGRPRSTGANKDKGATARRCCRRWAGRRR